MMFIFACSRRLGVEPEHSIYKDQDVNCNDTHSDDIRINKVEGT